MSPIADMRISDFMSVKPNILARISAGVAEGSIALRCLTEGSCFRIIDSAMKSSTACEYSCPKRFLLFVLNEFHKDFKRSATLAKNLLTTPWDLIFFVVHFAVWSATHSSKPRLMASPSVTVELLATLS